MHPGAFGGPTTCGRIRTPGGLAAAGRDVIIAGGQLEARMIAFHAGVPAHTVSPPRFCASRGCGGFEADLDDAAWSACRILASSGSGEVAVCPRGLDRLLGAGAAKAGEVHSATLATAFQPGRLPAFSVRVAGADPVRPVSPVVLVALVEAAHDVTVEQLTAVTAQPSGHRATFEVSRFPPFDRVGECWQSRRACLLTGKAL